MNGAAVFVSDVHIHYGDVPYRDRFVDFLLDVPRFANRLYIHGDLFDFYVGPKQGRQAFYAPMFDAIRTLTRSGVFVGVMVGNRDFTMNGDGGFSDAGATLLDDEIEVELGPRVAHLSHGDQFCLDDRSYLVSRIVLRFPPVTWLVKALPLFVAGALARGYRRHSSRKMASLRGAGKNRLGTILRGVETLLRRKSYDYVICGHIHHLAETPIENRPGTRLFTTGAWEEGPNCLHFDGNDLRIVRL